MGTVLDDLVMHSTLHLILVFELLQIDAHN